MAARRKVAIADTPIYRAAVTEDDFQALLEAALECSDEWVKDRLLGLCAHVNQSRVSGLLWRMEDEA